MVISRAPKRCKGYYAQKKLENTKKLTELVMEKWADHPNVKGKTADEMYGAGYVKGTDMHTPIIEVARGRARVPRRCGSSRQQTPGLLPAVL